MQSALLEARQEADGGAGKGKRSCTTSNNSCVLNKGKDAARARSAWTPPKEGWIKLNVDGSFVAQTGQADVGVVARNSQGKVVFAAWEELIRCSDAAEEEASACMIGLRIAVQRTPGKVILETDCSRVAHAMQSEVDWSELGFIIGEAREYMKLLEAC